MTQSCSNRITTCRASVSSREASFRILCDFVKYVDAVCLRKLHQRPCTEFNLRNKCMPAEHFIFLPGSVQEFCQFASKTIVERTSVSTRQSVKQDVYMCHVYVRSDNLSAVLIADHEYPGEIWIFAMIFPVTHSINSLRSRCSHFINEDHGRICDESL